MTQLKAFHNALFPTRGHTMCRADVAETQTDVINNSSLGISVVTSQFEFDPFELPASLNEFSVDLRVDATNGRPDPAVSLALAW